MTRYQQVLQHLENHRSHWLVTGVAGFIGSNLLEALLKRNQKVTGLDNFSTGYRHNLEQVRKLVGENAWLRSEERRVGKEGRSRRWAYRRRRRVRGRDV